MYNATIDTISKEDIRNLETVAQVLSTINTGLKEFTSLRNGIKAKLKGLPPALHR